MLSYSIVSQHFMEPEGSIPNSQELSTCSYPVICPRLLIHYIRGSSQGNCGLRPDVTADE
jgi:hypothetical protein